VTEALTVAVMIAAVAAAMAFGGLLGWCVTAEVWNGRRRRRR
jgi:hypothetical protein